jgi:hypothetical protein
MTIACPLCANTNEIPSQPSSNGWAQAACSSCEANLVLVKESLSTTSKRSLRSALRLMPPSSEAKQQTRIVRSYLFLIVALTLAFGVFGYLYWQGDLPFETGLLQSRGGQ